MDLKEIEELELKYLNKYYFFLKFTLDEILEGLKTGDKIANDWKGKYGEGISDFSRGAERVFYSLLNGKGIGTPNSAPVGSDLFFEVKEAFIHIDLKTVGATLLQNSGVGENNIGDFANDIFVGTNQNSYSANYFVNEGTKKQVSRHYNPTLPPIYNKADKNNSKTCLTYFITMLYDKNTLEVLAINLLCMPNGLLSNIYQHRPLCPGKNLDKARFNFSRTPDFELLNEGKRVKIVYFQENMDERYLKRLAWQHNLYKSQK